MTVSELTARIKTTLEHQFELVEVEGEISNLHHAASGHYYFSLKDAQAIIGVVLFRGVALTLRALPQNGMRVLLKGRLSIYAQRGNYQLICNALLEMGSGAILIMLEERKQLLAKRGLFAAARKRVLPPYIKRAVLITSPQGAAIRDIIEITGRRNAALELVILPTLVQGVEAAHTICQQLARANRYAMGEVIVLTRGGGSLEDLLPFSEVSVVEAVAASEIPVISAVGHEIDTVLSDLAADVRAPTPSAAAELISLNREELWEKIKGLGRELLQGVRERIRLLQSTLQHYHPAQQKIYLQRRLQEYLIRFDDSRESLTQEIAQCTSRLSTRLQLAETSLQALSPRNILQRGYALVYALPERALISDAAQSAPQKKIEVQFATSHLQATVENSRRGAPNEGF